MATLTGEEWAAVFGATSVLTIIGFWLMSKWYDHQERKQK